MFSSYERIFGKLINFFYFIDAIVTKLCLVFLIYSHSHSQSPWLEFVPMWEVKTELNSLVMDWMQLAAYQKSLPFKPQPPQLKYTNGKG